MPLLDTCLVVLHLKINPQLLIIKFLKMHFNLLDIQWISLFLFDKLFIHGIFENIPSHHGSIKNFFFFTKLLIWHFCCQMYFLAKVIFCKKKKSGFTSRVLYHRWLSNRDCGYVAFPFGTNPLSTRSTRIHCTEGPDNATSG